MLNDILYVIIFVLYTVCFYHYLTFSFHMLQLSSYHNPTHLLYENNHQRYIYAPYKVFLCLPPLMLLIGRGFFTAALILSLPVMLWFAYISKPLKAKKPFVVTARVKRLYCAAFVLYGIVCLAAFLCPICHPSFLLALTAVFSVFIYPFTRLCNTINRPIKRSVANHYIKEAEDILKSKEDMTVIGITGSYGKTSTKYFLNSILSYRFESLMTPASYNTTMGVVRTVRENLKPTTSHFVVEMGARHLGEIKEICDIVHPNMGIIASIGPQHLETFGSLDNVVKAKMELYDAVKQNGTVFLNIDSDPIYENLPTEGKIVTYGIKRDADYMAYDLSVSEMGISFYVKTPEGETERFTTKLLGAHNVLNILGAISVAHKLGMSLKSMTVPVACLEAVPHRLEIKGGGENVIIDDTNLSGTIIVTNDYDEPYVSPDTYSVTVEYVDADTGATIANTRRSGGYEYGEHYDVTSLTSIEIPGYTWAGIDGSDTGVIRGDVTIVVMYTKEEDITDPEPPLIDPEDPDGGEEDITDPEPPLVDPDIPDENIDNPDIPKTGGMTGAGFLMAGLAAVALGTSLKKKKGDK